MRLFPPGSAAWLLAHEVRLGWRGMSPKKDGKKKQSDASRITLIILASLAVVVIGLAGVGFGFLAGRFPLPQTRWCR